MATIGLSKPFFAIYSENGGVVSYANGGVLGKYTALQLQLENASENILYADNGPAESDSGFAGGTFSVTTDDLRPDVAKAIFGLTEETISAQDVTTAGAKWQVNDDDQVIPYLGVGGVLTKKVDGEVKYVAFVLEKVQFQNNGMDVTTQGETIEWQTPTLEGKLFRSDNAKHSWRRLSTLLDSEADAIAAVKGFLNIT